MSEISGAAQQSEPVISNVRRWMAVPVLGVATFTIVATEFVPIGLLSSIAMITALQ